jgi:hypothetical protein
LCAVCTTNRSVLRMHGVLCKLLAAAAPQIVGKLGQCVLVWCMCQGVWSCVYDMVWRSADRVVDSSSCSSSNGPCSVHQGSNHSP